MSSLIQDIRYARGMMLRTPMLTVAVVLTVALAIAANTSIFSFVNAELLHPLPFRDPTRSISRTVRSEARTPRPFASTALRSIPSSGTAA
jgi:hypothetical protein